MRCYLIGPRKLSLKRDTHSASSSTFCTFNLSLIDTTTISLFLIFSHGNNNSKIPLMTLSLRLKVNHRFIDKLFLIQEVKPLVFHFSTFNISCLVIFKATVGPTPFRILRCPYGFGTAYDKCNAEVGFHAECYHRTSQAGCRSC